MFFYLKQTHDKRPTKPLMFLGMGGTFTWSTLSSLLLKRKGRLTCVLDRSIGNEVVLSPSCSMIQQYATFYLDIFNESIQANQSLEGRLKRAKQQGTILACYISKHL